MEGRVKKGNLGGKAVEQDGKKEEKTLEEGESRGKKSEALLA